MTLIINRFIYQYTLSYTNMSNISYKAAMSNSKLTDFSGTKELVIMNSIPSIKFDVKRKEISDQSRLFEFC